MSSEPVQTFHMDSRLPVSPNVSESDPSNPKNVTKNLLVTQNQATADTKYDIYPPTRVGPNDNKVVKPAAACKEGFFDCSVLPNNIHMVWIVFTTSLLTSFISISLLTYTENKYARIVFIIAAIISINYAIGSLEKITV